jgi:ribonuclease HI
MDAESRALLAATDSLLLMDQLVLEPQDIIFFTDSRSCLQALRGALYNLRPTSPLLMHLLNGLVTLAQRIPTSEVILQWIPAHRGIPGNDVVDCLAKQACRLPQGDVPVPLTAAAAANRARLLTAWRTEWLQATTAAPYRQAVPPRLTASPSIAAHDPLYSLPTRWDQVRICRLRADRYPFKRFLFHIEQHLTGLCDLCQVSESADHVLLACPLWQGHRQEAWPLSHHMLTLSACLFHDAAGMMATLRFLELCGR